MESISLGPLNSLEMAAAGTASMHGSTPNHSFCLQREPVRDYLCLWGHNAVCLSCSLIDRMNLGVLLPLLKVQGDTHMLTRRCSILWLLRLHSGSSFHSLPCFLSLLLTLFVWAVNGSMALIVSVEILLPEFWDIVVLSSKMKATGWKLARG